MRGLGVALRSVGLLQSGHVAGIFDGGALHPKADTEIGDFAFAGELNRVDHALNAALAKATGHQNAIVAPQARSSDLRRSDLLSFDPFENGFLIVGQAAMEESFAEAFVGVFELDVFANDRNADFAG